MILTDRMRADMPDIRPLSPDARFPDPGNLKQSLQKVAGRYAHTGPLSSIHSVGSIRDTHRGGGGGGILPSVHLLSKILWRRGAEGLPIRDTRIARVVLLWKRVGASLPVAIRVLPCEISYVMPGVRSRKPPDPLNLAPKRAWYGGVRRILAVFIGIFRERVSPRKNRPLFPRINRWSRNVPYIASDGTP